MIGSVTRSGARRRGDDYQDIVALELLVDWLGHSERYEWVIFESDEAGYLDDIVALKTNGELIVQQVKFSNYPDSSNDPWTWQALLHQGGSTSLLQKWATTLEELNDQYPDIDASVISNRQAALDLEVALNTSTFLIQFEHIPTETRQIIIEQLGSEMSARSFFKNCKFRLNYPNLVDLEEAQQRQFFRLGGEPIGWNHLKEAVRNWTNFKNKPHPKGKIFLDDIKASSRWNRPQALPQEFEIPPDYVPPSTGFHDDVMERLLIGDERLCCKKCSEKKIGSKGVGLISVFMRRGQIARG